MQKDQRIARELFAHDRHNIPGSDKAGMCVPNPPFPLLISRSQPFIRKREALTAVIVLRVLNAHEASIPLGCAVLRHSVRDLREDLSQVDGCVRVVTNAEEQYIAVQLMDAADWALETMRGQR